MTTEAKKNYADKLHMELVPVAGIKSDARALDYGAFTKGYGVNAWLKLAREGGFGWMTAYGALLRHITSWVEGEDYDLESGLHHLDHVGANLKFLQTFVAEGAGVDDRPVGPRLVVPVGAILVGGGAHQRAGKGVAR